MQRQADTPKDDELHINGGLLASYSCWPQVRETLHVMPFWLLSQPSINRGTLRKCVRRNAVRFSHERAGVLRQALVLTLQCDEGYIGYISTTKSRVETMKVYCCWRLD